MFSISRHWKKKKKARNKTRRVADARAFNHLSSQNFLFKKKKKPHTFFFISIGYISLSHFFSFFFNTIILLCMNFGSPPLSE